MTTETETPETTPETETETVAVEAIVEATAEVTPEHQTILHRIKEAGEVGKKEWEQALGKAREFFSQAREEAEGSENPAKTALEHLQDQGQSLFGRAQTRGAELLLRLITSVRKGAESLEGTLREAREPSTEEAPEAPAPAAA